MILSVEQIVLGMHRSIQSLALGWHRGDLFGWRIPAVPFTVDRVVATEDRHPIIFGIRPGGGAVRQGFGEEQQGASRATIGFPQW